MTGNIIQFGAGERYSPHRSLERGAEHLGRSLDKTEVPALSLDPSLCLVFDTHAALVAYTMATDAAHKRVWMSGARWGAGAMFIGGVILIAGAMA